MAIASEVEVEADREVPKRRRREVFFAAARIRVADGRFRIDARICRPDVQVAPGADDRGAVGPMNTAVSVNVISEATMMPSWFASLYVYPLPHSPKSG